MTAPHDCASAEAFARDWIAAWNRRDIDAIVAHYAPKGRFTSPVALERMGTATIIGRDMLKAYWSGARKLPSLTFTLDRAIWDAARRELVILYIAERGGQRSRAMEAMVFGADGFIREGEAMYGVPLP
ncbi:MAG TPA: nuclear transport factor 2 family protein [Alphaproteobacteria bacterium]|jgi:steroid delta-isomerase